MKMNNTTKKHAEKTYRSEHFSCALCGGRDISSGIIFRGRCICGRCAEYIRSEEAEAAEEKEVYGSAEDGAYADSRKDNSKKDR